MIVIVSMFGYEGARMGNYFEEGPVSKAKVEAKVKALSKPNILTITCFYGV